jgi:hypothetical protein
MTESSYSLLQNFAKLQAHMTSTANHPQHCTCCTSCGHSAMAVSGCPFMQSVHACRDTPGKQQPRCNIHMSSACQINATFKRCDLCLNAWKHTPDSAVACCITSAYLLGSRTTALTGASVALSSRFTHSKPVGPPAPRTTFTDMTQVAVADCCGCCSPQTLVKMKK